MPGAYLGCNGALRGAIQGLRCLGSLQGEEELSQGLQKGALTPLDSALAGLGMFHVIRHAGSQQLWSRGSQQVCAQAARLRMTCLRCARALYHAITCLGSLRALQTQDAVNSFAYLFSCMIGQWECAQPDAYSCTSYLLSSAQGASVLGHAGSLGGGNLAKCQGIQQAGSLTPELQAVLASRQAPAVEPSAPAPQQTTSAFSTPSPHLPSPPYCMPSEARACSYECEDAATPLRRFWSLLQLCAPAASVFGPCSWRAAPHMFHL